MKLKNYNFKENFKKVLEDLKRMQKSESMMLLSFHARVQLRSLLEYTELVMQAMEVPFHMKASELVSGFLNLARHWLQEKSGAKMLTGSEAVVHLWKIYLKGGPPANEKLLMRMAPFAQLLPSPDQVALREAIGCAAAPARGIKRLGSKQALGMCKRLNEKRTLQAQASSASGSTIRLSVFD